MNDDKNIFPDLRRFAWTTFVGAIAMFIVWCVAEYWLVRKLPYTIRIFFDHDLPLLIGLPLAHYAIARNRLGKQKGAAALSTLIASAGAFILALGCTAPFDAPGDTAIIRAAKRGNVWSVERIIRKNPEALHERNRYGNSAFGCAILAHDYVLVARMIELGADVNPRSETDFPPVQACMSHIGDSRTSLRILDLLLDNGANPDVIYQSRGWSAVHLALNNGCLESFLVLVERGASLETRNKEGETLLEFAQGMVELYSDPKFNLPHGEFSDPKVRQRAIDDWQSRVDLVKELTAKYGAESLPDANSEPL